VEPITERFLRAGLAERLAMVDDSANAAALTGYLGADGFAEYRQLAAEAGPGHLAGGPPTNLIFLPGVMGSVLGSAGLGGIWWLDVLNRKHIGDLRLSPGDDTDHDPRARIEAVGVMSTYEGFLAAGHETGDFGHLALAYDWRKSLPASAERVRDAVLSAYDSSGGPVHIVAHSMGGLLARTTLMTYPELWSRIGRVVFIGTPHYGSPAIAGYLKNHLWGAEPLALLGRYLDRPAFRSLRGVLNLMPAPADVYPGGTEGRHPCAGFDMYDAAAWRLDLDSPSQQALQSALDGTARLHRDLHAWHGRLDPDQRDRMAIIAGLGRKTLFRLAYRRAGFGTLWRHMDRVTAREPGNIHRDGDGRVPLASATLDGVEIRYIEGEHGRLPTIPAVYQDVFRFLRGQPMHLPRTPAEALDRSHLAGPPDDTVTPALSSAGIAPPPPARIAPPPPAGIAPPPPAAGVATPPSAPGIASSDEDPGYLDLDDVDEKAVDTLDAAVAAGELPAFARVRIL
jgi:pimeloyl-ACP methyl ester carboxylesterase